MSISIMCRIVLPKKDKRLPGVSSDWETYQTTFGRGGVTGEHIPILRAMHRAAVGSATDEDTLWSALADRLERLPEGAELQVWAEW